MTDRPLVLRAVVGAVAIGLLVALVGGAAWVALDRGGPGGGATPTPADRAPASASAAGSPSASATITTAPDGSATLAPPTSVGSGSVVSAAVSPFSRCSAGGRGTVTTNSEAEPSIAVDPDDPRRFVVAWQQDRWSNGAARGLVLATTADAGAGWQRQEPPFSACAAAGRSLPTRVSDPWLAFGPDGTAYLAGLAVTQPAVSAVAVSRSTDRGATWSSPTTIARSESAAVFNDKESVTADPTRPGYAYAVWDQSGGGESEGGQQPATTGSVMFARTQDAGGRWSAPRRIQQVAGTPVGNIVSVAPDGTLIDVFALVPPNGRGTAAITALRSTNAGVDWSGPVTVGTIAGGGVIGSQPPGIRGGGGLPATAVDPRTGDLLVVWTSVSGGTPAVVLARSTDAGQTFASPVAVPRGSSSPVFLPSIAITSEGAIGVEYTDLRAATPGLAFLANRFLAVSTDGGTSWRERRLTDTFDYAAAPNAGGRFLGDYSGLATAGSAFVSAFAVTTGAAANPTDMVVRVDPLDDPGAIALP